VCGYGSDVPAWLRGPITGLCDVLPLLGVFRWFRWMLLEGLTYWPPPVYHSVTRENQPQPRR